MSSTNNQTQNTSKNTQKRKKQPQNNGKALQDELIAKINSFNPSDKRKGLPALNVIKKTIAAIDRADFTYSVRPVVADKSLSVELVNATDIASGIISSIEYKKNKAERGINSSNIDEQYKIIENLETEKKDAIKEYYDIIAKLNALNEKMLDAGYGNKWDLKAREKQNEPETTDAPTEEAKKTETKDKKEKAA